MAYVGSILVSGFEPFGGERVNPSARIASSVILPVTWDGAVERLVAAEGQAAALRATAEAVTGGYKERRQPDL